MRKKSFDAFSKIKDSISDSIRGKGVRDRQSKNWMDRSKKKLYKVQPSKKKK
jgi:hypothetical protein